MERAKIQSNITASTLGFQLGGIAVRLFDKWRDAASCAYHIHIETAVKHESKLKADLLDCMVLAAEKLINEKSNIQKAHPGWSLGYFYGHVQGALNTRWTYGYITRQSSELKELIALKATWHYLNHDRETLARIGRLYDLFMELRGVEQLAELPPVEKVNTTPQVVSLQEYAAARNSIQPPFAQMLLPYLEKDVERRIHQLLHGRQIQCLDHIDSFFSDQLIIESIGRDHFA